MAMHPIPIPDPGLIKTDREDHVSFCCVVELEFSKEGFFTRTSRGDRFCPALPNRKDVKAGDKYPCMSPNNFPVTVKWKFKAKSDGKVTKGTIFVEKDAKCEPAKPKSTRTAKTRR
jgi:hypothetical protein